MNSTLNGYEEAEIVDGMTKTRSSWLSHAHRAAICTGCTAGINGQVKGQVKGQAATCSTP